jgi:hypothetical protein
LICLIAPSLSDVENNLREKRQKHVKGASPNVLVL